VFSGKWLPPPLRKLSQGKLGESSGSKQGNSSSGSNKQSSSKELKKGKQSSTILHQQQPVI
jgi:hypothetical protein